MSSALPTFGERFFDGTAAFFEAIEDRFNPLSDAVEPLVKAFGVLLRLIFASGRVDLNAVFFPAGLPLLPDQPFIGKDAAAGL